MSHNAIEIRDVSKMYRLGEVGTGTISHDLNRWWHRIRGKEDPYLILGQENRRDTKGSEYVWALKDVNFEVAQGEVLGIIGKNGAGKSTLLKLLSRVTAPTTGHIRAKGRIASLLEVGTGFHPELTGKENIFLNGAILGMTRHEIRKKFDEIVDFAGVERYIDTPVKRYSSGMYVRLAFGVAAHLESEILIVDEVLAVGDAEFQNKCLGKMSQVSKGEGRTVLFVSHNMGAVKQLCNKAVVMERGTVVLQSDVNTAIDHYLTVNTEAERFLSWEEDKRPSNDELSLLSLKILDNQQQIDNSLTTLDDIHVEINYNVKKEIRDLRIAMSLLASDGQNILSSSDFNFQPADRIRMPGIYKSICKIPARLLTTGKYFISIDFDIPKQRSLIKDILVQFSIDELMYNQLGITYAARPGGIIHPYLEWEIKKIN